MAPPPATPSDKFIFKKPGSKITPRGVNSRDFSKSATKRQDATGQFATIPRFSKPSPREMQAASHPPRSPSPTRPLMPVSGKTLQHQREDVQEAVSQPSEDDEMLDNEPPNPFPLEEPPNLPAMPQQHETSAPHSLHHPSKRPRLEQPPRPRPSQTPSKPNLSRFIIPPPNSASNSPRPTPFFPSPTPQSSTQLNHSTQTNSTNDDPTPSRPIFLKPPAPAPNAVPVEPLPEAFSPHRKGQRFVAGGMAAKLFSWVVEVGQGAEMSRRGREYLKGGDFVREFVVRELRGRGDGEMVFVVGEEGEKVMLKVGGDNSGSGGKKEVVVGDVVGIRAPSWDVDIGGEIWVVGADWRVLR